MPFRVVLYDQIVDWLIEGRFTEGICPEIGRRMRRSCTQSNRTKLRSLSMRKSVNPPQNFKMIIRAVSDQYEI